MELELESVLALLTVTVEKRKPKWTLLQTLKRSRQNYYFIPRGPLSVHSYFYVIVLV